MVNRKAKRHKDYDHGRAFTGYASLGGVLCGAAIPIPLGLYATFQSLANPPPFHEYLHGVELAVNQIGYYPVVTVIGLSGTASAASFGAIAGGLFGLGISMFGEELYKTGRKILKK